MRPGGKSRERQLTKKAAVIYKRSALSILKSTRPVPAASWVRTSSCILRTTLPRVMIDDLVGLRNLPQGLPFMTFLSAGLIAGALAQARHARRFLQPVARWRLATVGTVQSKPAFEFGDMSPQCRNLSRLRCNQRNKLFPRWLDRRVAIHRILESELAPVVHKNLRAQ